MQARDDSVAQGLRLASADRQLPQNVEVEEAIIGGILVDPNAIARIRSTVKPEHFYIGFHARLYQAACEVFDRGDAVDMLSVFSAAGGTADIQRAIARLMDSTVSAVNIDQMAMLLMDKWRRRQLISIGQQFRELGYHSRDGWEAIAAQAESKFYDLLLSAQSQSSLTALPEIAQERIDYLQAVEEGKVVTSLSTGFYDLDAMTNGGIQPGKLMITAGRPSMGKSAFSLHRGRNVAALSKRPVFFFSLEMSKEEWFDRLWSIESDIPGSVIAAATRSNQVWEHLCSGVSKLTSLPIWIDDSPGLDITKIATKSRHLAAEVGTPALIVIDYLQIMDGTEPDGSMVQAQAIGRTTRAAKRLARSLKCTVDMVSQLSRGVESRTNKRPVMSDLRDSGSIEADADTIMLLYRDEYYNPDTPDRGIAEIIIGKQRGGATGTVKLLFEPQYTRFKNVARSAPRTEVTGLRASNFS